MENDMRDLPRVGAEAGALRGMVTVVTASLGWSSLARVGTCSAMAGDANAANDSSKACTRTNETIARGGGRRLRKRRQNVNRVGATKKVKLRSDEGVF